MPLLLIGNETKSTFDDFTISLLSVNPALKPVLKLVEICYGCGKGLWISAQYLSSIVGFQHNIVDYVIGWKRETNIRRQIATGTRE
jgi:hypothetical protein